MPDNNTFDYENYNCTIDENFDAFLYCLMEINIATNTQDENATRAMDDNVDAFL